MPISWYFSFLNRAGGSDGTLDRRPMGSAMTRDTIVNCSSSPASLSASGRGAGLLSRLPFGLFPCFLSGPSHLSLGSPPLPGAPTASLHGGGGRSPPPAPEAASIRDNTIPFPFTCPINICTMALSSEISPSWAC